MVNMCLLSPYPVCLCTSTKKVLGQKLNLKHHDMTEKGNFIYQE